MMKKAISIFAAVVLCACALAQTTENFLGRYNALVSRVGYSGIGVETLIEKWEKADPVDVNHMVARFNFYLDKAERDSVVVKYKPGYLGLTHILELKDSVGRTTYLFKEPFYDELLFAKAVECLDDAISMENSRLDFLVTKAQTLALYEKTKPVKTTELLMELIGRHFAAGSKWDCPGVEVDDELFLSEIQKFCIGFFNTGSEESFESMKKLSEKVLKFRPKDLRFINNLGAYYASFKKNDKKALKYYSQSQKLDPSDPVSRQNIGLIKRREAAKKARK